MSWQRLQARLYTIPIIIIWCPKYRKRILVGSLKEFLDQKIQFIAKSKHWEILEMCVLSDHIPLFVSYDPLVLPIKIVKTFKKVTANHAFKKFPNLKDVM